MARLIKRRAKAVRPPKRLAAKSTVESLKDDLLDELFCSQAKFPEVATLDDFYLALSYAVRDRLLHRWINSAHTYFHEGSRTVAYFSAEYLIGPQLGNNLINLGIYEQARKAVARLGLSLDDILEREDEPGLGNGGLGRLAACFIDSMATLEIPALGYGIRYEYGIFQQEIRDGWQVEVTDKWLRKGNPWEIPHPEIEYCVGFGGRTESFTDKAGRFCMKWIPEHIVKGTAFDTPVLGYGVETANMLRLWKAEACESFDFQAFNVGDYYRAVEQKVSSENLSRVLYPNDQPTVGKELRLEQEYFFVSCSLQDMIRIYLQREKSMDSFHRKYAVQLNDTHPAIAIPELMRILMDEHRMEWDKAWHVTTKTFAYTNHTLLPEALEKWPLPLFQRLLPRHFEIIIEINRRLLEEVRSRYPNDDARVSRMSLIDEDGEKQVRMANLACVGAHAINGVAALHTQILKQTVLKDFCEFWPGKCTNKTNGVTPRRFMVLSNPRLAQLITDTIGDSWIRNLDDLRQLEMFVEDSGFRSQWREIKQHNKRALADFIKSSSGVAIDPQSLFDIQVKRIHEYKRQHLNVLHIITLYNRLKKSAGKSAVPRTFIFGGKAAPGYYMAKLIIKLINSIAEVINNDPDMKGLLKVVFIPNFSVKLAQRIYPAADLSEQISTAGKEASGTGNMKFALNGALTIGTLDGANVEIRDEVGKDNFFLFGLTAAEVARRKAEGYKPMDEYNSCAELREAVDMIGAGRFSRGDRELFQPLITSLMERDEFMLFADYAAYVKCQELAGATYGNKTAWTRMSILNVSRMGRFSSDRAIKEYCEDIWHVRPVRMARSGGKVNHSVET
jgi:starch phosphorylase